MPRRRFGGRPSDRVPAPDSYRRACRARVRPPCRRTSWTFPSDGPPLNPAPSAFASPKSSTFARRSPAASPVSTMLAGFRSRWTMPFSCAASSAGGDLPRDGEGVGERQGAAFEPIGQRRSFDQLEDQCGDAVGFFQPVDRADVRVIERRERPRFAREAGAALGVGGEVGRQDLDGDVATELAVARAIDLAHAAGAERGDDRVGPELTIHHRESYLPQPRPRRRPGARGSRADAGSYSSSDSTSCRSASSPSHASTRNARAFLWRPGQRARDRGPKCCCRRSGAITAPVDVSADAPDQSITTLIGAAPGGSTATGMRKRWPPPATAYGRFVGRGTESRHKEPLRNGRLNLAVDDPDTRGHHRAVGREEKELRAVRAAIAGPTRHRVRSTTVLPGEETAARKPDYVQTRPTRTRSSGRLARTLHWFRCIWYPEKRSAGDRPSATASTDLVGSSRSAWYTGGGGRQATSPAPRWSLLSARAARLLQPAGTASKQVESGCVVSARIERDPHPVARPGRIELAGRMVGQAAGRVRRAQDR